MVALPTGDTLYGQLRPNWSSTTGVEAITSNMEFITIVTNVDIRTYAQNIVAGNTVAVSTQSQSNLNKLLEIVSLRGQPVIMGAVTGTTRFTLFMATEHIGGWNNVVSPNTLIQRIVGDGVNFGFGVDETGATPAGPNDSGTGTGGGLTVAFGTVLT